MASLPIDSTARIVVRYDGVMGERSVQFRVLSDASLTDGLAAAHNWFDTYKGLFHNQTHITGCDIYEEGATFSNPAIWANIDCTGSFTLEPNQFPRFAAMQGRGVTGHKVRLSFYSMNLGAMQDDYRLSPGENEGFEAARAAMATLYSSGVFCDIDHSQVFLKPYWNLGYNGYYQRKARKSG